MMLTTTICGKLLGIKPRVISSWCKKGYLKSVKWPAKIAHYYVLQAELIAFAQKCKLSDEIINRIRLYNRSNLEQLISRELASVT